LVTRAAKRWRDCREDSNSAMKAGVWLPNNVSRAVQIAWTKPCEQHAQHAINFLILNNILYFLKYQIARDPTW
jgi:hypothetical protein